MARYSTLALSIERTAALAKRSKTVIGMDRVAPGPGTEESDVSEMINMLN
jgi:hypothetical protein